MEYLELASVIKKTYFDRPRSLPRIKALMDEVRFEEGGAVIHMRKSVGEAPKLGDAISSTQNPVLT
jgi:hypothetical protein